MKYEKPEVQMVVSALDAVQAMEKVIQPFPDSGWPTHRCGISSRRVGLDDGAGVIGITERSGANNFNEWPKLTIQWNLDRRVVNAHPNGQSFRYLSNQAITRLQ